MTCREHHEQFYWGCNKTPCDPVADQYAGLVLSGLGMGLLVLLSVILAPLILYPMACLLIFTVDNITDLVSWLIKNSDQASVALGGMIALLITLVPRYIRAFQNYQDRKRIKKFHGHTYAYYRGAPAEDQW